VSSRVDQIDQLKAVFKMPIPLKDTAISIEGKEIYEPKVVLVYRVWFSSTDAVIMHNHKHNVKGKYWHYRLQTTISCEYHIYD
jgi:hypothetical protein